MQVATQVFMRALLCAEQFFQRQPFCLWQFQLVFQDNQQAAQRRRTVVDILGIQPATQLPGFALAPADAAQIIENPAFVHG